MPRRSVASLAITPVPYREPTPVPPTSLSPAEAAVWVRLVQSKPRGWFDDGGRPLLDALARHIVTFEMLAGQMSGLDLSDEAQLERFDKLAGMRDRESRQIRSLSTSLRLSPQSRYTPQAAATAAYRHGGALSPVMEQLIDASDRRRG